LVEDLTRGSLSPGSYIYAEFDPSSLWYNATYTLAAGWLKSGGRVSYNVITRPPDEIRSRLSQLGVGVDALEKDGKLRIWDWFRATLGQKSKEPYAMNSLKVADLSIFFAKGTTEPAIPNSLVIMDNVSILGTFNEEKSRIDFTLSRAIPNLRLRKITGIGGIMVGLHSTAAYKRLEGAVDGVLDFKVEEVEGELKTLMRIRVVRDLTHDSRWHQLKVNENSQVTLD
jgi:KaiC/GvpD/RAD55 family RecA-like ATPase